MTLPNLSIEIMDQADALNLRETWGDFEPSLVIYGAPCWRISREENKSLGQETDDGFSHYLLGRGRQSKPEFCDCVLGSSMDELLYTYTQWADPDEDANQ